MTLQPRRTGAAPRRSSARPWDPASASAIIWTPAAGAQAAPGRRCRLPHGLRPPVGATSTRGRPRRAGVPGDHRSSQREGLGCPGFDRSSRRARNRSSRCLHPPVARRTPAGRSAETCGCGPRRRCPFPSPWRREPTAQPKNTRKKTPSRDLGGPCDPGSIRGWPLSRPRLVTAPSRRRGLSSGFADGRSPRSAPWLTRFTAAARPVQPRSMPQPGPRAARSQPLGVCVPRDRTRPGRQGGVIAGNPLDATGGMPSGRCDAVVTSRKGGLPCDGCYWAALVTPRANARPS